MNQKRFSVKETVRIGGVFSGGFVRIIVDNQTGVNYLAGYGMGGMYGMTPLLDERGRIVIDYVDHLK